MDFEALGVLARFLKGAESSILLVLAIGDRPLTAAALQEATGYSDKPVSEALRRMAAVGLVAHQGRLVGWGMSDAGWDVVIERIVAREEREAEGGRGRGGGGRIMSDQDRENADGRGELEEEPGRVCAAAAEGKSAAASGEGPCEAGRRYSVRMGGSARAAGRRYSVRMGGSPRTAGRRYSGRAVDGDGRADEKGAGAVNSDVVHVRARVLDLSSSSIMQIYSSGREEEEKKARAPARGGGRRQGQGGKRGWGAAGGADRQRSASG